MKFSILTSCWNYEQFLPAYFDSVLNQQFQDYEIIFVDDCSRDGSLSYAESIQDKRLKVIHNSEHLGCGSSYNIALKHATGEICGVVDADDVVMKDAIRRIVRIYDRYPKLGYIYTQHYWCNGKLHRLRKGLSGSPLPGKSLAQSALNRRHCFSHWRTFKTKLRDKAVLFPDLKYSVDKNLGFVLEELSLGGFCPNLFYFYRYHSKNMSRTAAKQQKLTTRRLAKEFCQRRKRQGVKTFKIIKVKP